MAQKKLPILVFRKELSIGIADSETGRYETILQYQIN
jgi:hypothetical protein